MPSLLAAGLLGLMVVTAWASPFRLGSLSSKGAMTESPMAVTLMGALVLLGLWMATSDRWLGLFVVYTALNALRVHQDNAYGTAQWIALGAAGVMVTRMYLRLPVTRVAVLALAVSQIAYASLQWLGYDPFLDNLRSLNPLVPGFDWEGAAFNGAPVPNVMTAQIIWAPYVVGTLGNPNWLGALVAMTLPLAPLWLVPVFVLGLLLTKSMGALVAAVIGACVRWPKLRGPVVGLGVVVGVISLLTRPTSLLATVPARFHFQWLALKSMSLFAPLWGSGPGAWWNQHFIYEREWFAHAHNEVIQLYFEGGLIALICLGYWIAQHRPALAWRNPWTASAAALVAICQTGFPFHLASLALPSVVILGMATSEELHV